MTWDDELQAWIAEWGGDFELVGITPQIYNVLLWWGDRTGISIGVHYPNEKIPILMKQMPGVPSKYVSKTSGLYLNALPDGWIKIVPGGHEIRSHNPLEQTHDNLDRLLKGANE